MKSDLYPSLLPATFSCRQYPPSVIIPFCYKASCLLSELLQIQTFFSVTVSKGQLRLSAPKRDEFSNLFPYFVIHCSKRCL